MSEELEAYEKKMVGIVSDASFTGAQQRYKDWLEREYVINKDELTTLKAENERLESLVDAEIQEIGKLRVERNALQASIDDAPSVKMLVDNDGIILGYVDDACVANKLIYKHVNVALVQKSEHTAEPLGECTDNI